MTTDEICILSPTAILGYGFPVAPFLAGMADGTGASGARVIVPVRSHLQL